MDSASGIKLQAMHTYCTIARVGCDGRIHPSIHLTLRCAVSDTIANSLTSAMKCLCTEPEWQEKIAVELEEAGGWRWGAAMGMWEACGSSAWPALLVKIIVTSRQTI